MRYSHRVPVLIAAGLLLASTSNAVAAAPTHITAISAFDHSGTAAGCSDPAGYGATYALQFTASNTVQQHDGCGIGTNSYGGWIGIDGQIGTPAALPSYASGFIHDVGWIGAYWIGAGPGGTDAWIQVGWYSGEIGDGSACPTWDHCIIRVGNYGMYVESMDLSGNYHVRDLGYLSPGHNETYRVEFTANGCWNAYYNYNTLALQVCNLPSSGVMWAVQELKSLTGSPDGRTSWFGSSTAGTNQTLRIRGCHGYEDWDQSLSCGPGGTRQSDLRGLAAGRNLVMSSGKLWYYLETYQG